jgi:MFS family permease
MNLAAPPVTTSHGRYMALAAAFLGWMFDGVEMGMFPLCARPALTEMFGPTATAKDIGFDLGLLNAMFLIGAAAGGVAFGWLGDRVGRVRAMTVAVLVYSLFSAMGAFAQEPWQLAVPRLLASFGMGGEWALGVALVMEAWPSASRPLMAGLIGAAANFGFLLIAVVGLTIATFIKSIDPVLHALLPDAVATAATAHQAWRLLLFLGALPAVLTLFMIFFVPESESWKKSATGAPKNRIGDIFKPGIGGLVLKASLLAAITLLGTWGSTQQMPGWSASLAAGTTNPILTPAETTAYTQIVSGFGACVGCVLGALIAQWANRRSTFFGMAALSLISSQILFRIPVSFGPGFLVGVFLVGGITASFYGWLPLYLPELFPTRIRATAQGFCYNAGRVFAAAGAVGGGALLQGFGGDYQRMCAVVSLIYIPALIVIWFCPETKGRELPA